MNDTTVERIVVTREAAHRAALDLYAQAQALIADGKRVRMLAEEDENDRSLRQNRFYWSAVLPQISDQAPGRWTVDAWHELFKRQILGYEVIRAQVAGRKRPTIYRRLRSTTALTVKQMSDYLDKVMAMAANDLGVVFDIDPAEREAVRYQPPARKAKTPVPEAAAAPA